jgi:hypothetical protein
MRFVKFFFLGILTMTFTAALAQNEGAEGGFQFEEEKILGAEGASGTEGALSPEFSFGSDGLIRADGAGNDGSEGSNRTDGGNIGSGEMIRSNGGTTLGNDDRIFVRPPTPGIGDGGLEGGGDGSFTPGGGSGDAGSGGDNTSPAEPEGAVPVDGGLALLLIAGAGYGSKKAYDFRKSQKSKVKS